MGQSVPAAEERGVFAAEVFIRLDESRSAWISPICFISAPFGFPTLKDSLDITPIAAIQAYGFVDRRFNPALGIEFDRLDQLIGDQWCKHTYILLVQSKNVGAFDGDARRFGGRTPAEWKGLLSSHDRIEVQLILRLFRHEPVRLVASLFEANANAGVVSDNQVDPTTDLIAWLSRCGDET